MLCDLDKTVDRKCILRSPLTLDSFNWTCMLVEYHLSSHDVMLTLDLLVGGVSNTTYTLLANESARWISKPDLMSSCSVEFTVSRYLVSTEDYEYALVSSVAFLPCPADTGTSQCMHAEICIFIIVC